MTKHRTQLFLEREQYERLVRIAGSEGISISEVVRRFVDLGLQRQADDREMKLRALRNADDWRKELERRHGVYEGDPVMEVRREREREMDAVVRPAGQT